MQYAESEELVSMEDATPEQIEQEIINISNQTLRNLGIQYVITRSEALHGDRFYLAVFAEIFRNIDFNQIEPSDNPEGQAQNIQALIDILERYVLDIDLEGVKGSEIVKGNQRQILELLLLIHQISDLVNRELEDDTGEEPQEEVGPHYPPQYEEDSYPQKQSAEKPEPKNFIFPDPGEFEQMEGEGVEEVEAPIEPSKEEMEGEMKVPPEGAEYFENSGEEGEFLGNLPPGEYRVAEEEPEHIKFYEDVGKKLKERGFENLSTYQQQLQEQKRLNQSREGRKDEQAQDSGSGGANYSSSDRAQLRYERPSNVPRHLKHPNQEAGDSQQPNLTDSSPPVTTQHLEELLEGVNRERREEQEIPEDIHYKGQRLPQAHAYRNNFANEMSDGDQTTQIPKHSQTGVSGLQHSRGAPGKHNEFDFYHAPEDRMEEQDEELEPIEMEVQREGKADPFEGRRLSHSKSNKNLIESSGGGGPMEDDSMVSGDPRQGPYPQYNMKPRGYEEQPPPPIIEPHTEKEQISDNIQVEYPPKDYPPKPPKKQRPATAKRGSRKKVSRKNSKNVSTGGDSGRAVAQHQEILKERNRSYENVYNILTDNLLQAKSKLQSISEVVFPEDDEEFKEKIARDQAKIDMLHRDKIKEIKIKSQKYMRQVKLNENSIRRQQKLQSLREKQLEERLRNQQKSQMLKRNAQQVRMCHRIYKKASELEKDRLVQEKRDYLLYRKVQNNEKRIIFESIRNAYLDRIDLMREKIHVERFERKIAQQARNQALKEMERQLRDNKRQEIEEYLNILRQEDERYDFENNNLDKFEEQLVQIYKKR